MREMDGYANNWEVDESLFGNPDWGPLLRYLAPLEEEPEGWMFMEGYTNGYRNYKHKLTREGLMLNQAGRPAGKGWHRV